jgi:hypothetical protein
MTHQELIEAFNHIKPMAGFVLINHLHNVQPGKSLAQVVEVSPGEEQIKKDDWVLVVLDDAIGFEFHGKYYHRIPINNVLGILSIRLNEQVKA